MLFRFCFFNLFFFICFSKNVSCCDSPFKCDADEAKDVVQSVRAARFSSYRSLYYLSLSVPCAPQAPACGSARPVSPEGKDRKK